MTARRVPIQVLPGCRGRVPVGELRRVASFVLDAEEVARHVEVEVVLADSSTVRDLNRLYRGKDEPTDVLSFESLDYATAAILDTPHADEFVEIDAANDLEDAEEADDVEDEDDDFGRMDGGESRPVMMPRFVEPPDAQPSLGEVIVCLPVAELQAAGSDHSIAGEVSHLIVHGLLHLLGYDHEEPAESAKMQSREDELLAALGYAGSYAHGDH